MKESILSKIEDLVVKGIESEAEAVFISEREKKTLLRSVANTRR